ncbi:MAG: RsmB/NOP family class I SAM-dependent RNA methyltransferase [bacterium]|nr:RsmB/NOP family class I SAM-dependent RNA methyltransferase [bacterium]
MATKDPLWLITARDVLTQHQSTKEPLALIMTRLCRLRRLGSHDRKYLREAVFNYVRQQPWPSWFLQKIKHAYPDAVVDLETQFRTRANPVLAVDRRFQNIDLVMAELSDLDVQTRKSVLIKDALVVESDLVFADLPLSLQKSLWLMDEGSQIIAASVGAKADQTVLDMCAGGGGKTRYLMQTEANIVAMDISLKRLQDALKRPGVKPAKAVVADGMHPPFEHKSFDWILIDAPCSGTGTIRREPDLLMRLQEVEIAKYVQKQRMLIKSAVRLLKPEGRLIFATCSILPEENSENARWIEQEIKNLKPFPLSDCWSDQVLVKVKSKANMLQLLPTTHGCDGFYIAAYQMNA